MKSIHIDENIHKTLKILAINKKLCLNKLIENILKNYLNKQKDLKNE